MKTIGRIIFLVCFGTFSIQAQNIAIDSLATVLDEIGLDTLTQLCNPETTDTVEAGNWFAGFLLPGNGGKIISGFGPRSGRMHYGTDLKMERGDTVVAVTHGIVSRASYGYGFGNIIIIGHNNNLETYYAHLSEFLVKKGDSVSRGTAIGLAGSTGRARGVHLHFEMRENNKPFDPEMVYDFENLTVRNEALQTESLAQLHRVLKPKGYSNNEAVPEFYSVRPGDSLWRISRKFKVSISEICRLNNISENSILQIGQALRMY